VSLLCLSVVVRQLPALVAAAFVAHRTSAATAKQVGRVRLSLAVFGISPFHTKVKTSTPPAATTTTTAATTSLNNNAKNDKPHRQ
jgi:hypothetical protein